MKLLSTFLIGIVTSALLSLSIHAQDVSTHNNHIGHAEIILKSSTGFPTNTFVYGEAFSASYVVRNESDHPRYHSKPSPGIGATFEIFMDDEVVRTMGKREVARSKITDEGLFSPGGTLTFTASSFDGIEDIYGPAAPPLPIGVYTIRAIPRIIFLGFDPPPVLQTTFEVTP